MFPNSLHLVSGKYVQVECSIDSTLTLQDKVMEYAERQHEDLQEDMLGPNIWRIDNKIIGIKPS